MWIALLITLLAVLMMVGPLMAIRPTKGQARLADLRQLALREGLIVRMRQDPSPHGKGLMAVYTINLQSKKNDPAQQEHRKARKAQPWLLVRRDYSHGLHFQGEWDWQGHGRPAESMQAFLLQHLVELDGSFYAVESTGHSFGLYWTETLAGKSPAQRVAGVAGWLRALLEREPALLD